uniref:hypothetical protein n=1 Tax=Sulfitobacter pontiacus TaxID=60137 RepID=UPI0026B53464
MRDGVTTEERDRIKTLERENKELRQANEILRKASAYFAPPPSRMFTCAAGQRDGTRPPTEAMIAFIEDQRIVYGVESICRVLPIAPSIARQAIAKQSAERELTITNLRAERTLPKLLHGISVTQSYAPRSNGSGTKTIRSTEFARRGTS